MFSLVFEHLVGVFVVFYMTVNLELYFVLQSQVSFCDYIYYCFDFYLNKSFRQNINYSLYFLNILLSGSSNFNHGTKEEVIPVLIGDHFTNNLQRKRSW